MNAENLPDLGFDWAELLELLKTTGVDLAINLVTALAIFIIGRWVAGMVTKALRTLMQKRAIPTAGEIEIPSTEFLHPGSGGIRAGLCHARK